jgi:hypothetical protein
MFLRQRATQAEYCDRDDLSPTEVRQTCRQLARFNELVRVSDAFQRGLADWLGRERVGRLSILDLGAADGSLGDAITEWARRQGWDWRVTSADRNPLALALGAGNRRVAADVCALPFADGSFDVVLGSQMTHHLTDAEAVEHFREAWRVTGDALFLADTHRNSAALAVLWGVLALMRVTPEFRADGLQSVRRGWRVGEWESLARQAGIPVERVWMAYGSRVMLQARKTAGNGAPNSAL